MLDRYCKILMRLLIPVLESTFLHLIYPQVIGSRSKRRWLKTD